MTRSIQAGRARALAATIAAGPQPGKREVDGIERGLQRGDLGIDAVDLFRTDNVFLQIGRASCRERV